MAALAQTALGPDPALVAVEGRLTLLLAALLETAETVELPAAGVAEAGT
jgi:hypothetical protein